MHDYDIIAISKDFPKECSLHFNNPIMKSTYKSIRLCFEAVYSNILIVHICCNTAKQPILKETILLVSS